MLSSVVSMSGAAYALGDSTDRYRPAPVDDRLPSTGTWQDSAAFGQQPDEAGNGNGGPPSDPGNGDGGLPDNPGNGNGGPSAGPDDDGQSAGQDDDTGDDASADDSGTANETTDELPSLTDERLLPEQRLALVNVTLQELDPTSPREERAIDRAREEVQSALQHYEAGRATDRQAFDSQSRALHALARAAGGDNDETLANISVALSMASNQSARTAIRDANASILTYGGDLDRNTQRYAERAIRNGRAALVRATDAQNRLNRGNREPRLQRVINTRASAIDHYRSAHHHAGRAMDRVARDTVPELSLSTDRPFEHNDSVRIYLEATLTDVRPHLYENATVTVLNGSATAEDVSFVQLLAGQGRTSGTAALDLGSEPENVTVRVHAASPHNPQRSVAAVETITVDEDRIIPDPPDPDEFNAIEITNETSGVTVEAGGEGLWEEELDVWDRTPNASQSFRAGPVVRVESGVDIDNATIRIPVNDSVPQSEYGNLSVYTWNGTRDDQWTPVNTTFVNGTAIAQVEHFSFFSVYHEVRWRNALTVVVPIEEIRTGEPLRFDGSADFDCEGACAVSNGTELSLSGSPSSGGSDDIGASPGGSSGDSDWRGEDPPNSRFAGGAGTPAHPYRIATLSHLDNVRTDLDAHYVLVSDIDAGATQNWNGGRGFDPIGSWRDRFRGTFDGQGHTISNLHIDRDHDDVGLFAALSSSRITNIVIDGWTIRGDSGVGTLAGRSRFGYPHISSITATDITVSAEAEFGSAGGIVGRLYHPRIGATWFGTSGGATYHDRSSRSPGSSDTQATGVQQLPNESAVGQISISDVSLAGDIRGDSGVGGIVGYTRGVNGYDLPEEPIGYQIQLVETDVQITGSRRVGGIIGHAQNSAIQDASATAEIRVTETLGRDFEGADYIGGAVGWGAESELEQVLVNTDIGLDRTDVTEAFDIGGLAGSWSGFVYRSSATGSIDADDAVDAQNVGGLLGRASGPVEESFSTVDIRSDGISVGGLVGHIQEPTTVSSSYAQSPVRGQDQIGGLIGSISVGQARISASYATGRVAGATSRVGGLVGWQHGDSPVTASYWDRYDTGQPSSAGGTSRTTGEMTGGEAAANLWGFDFNSVWATTPGYPDLQWHHRPADETSQATWEYTPPENVTQLIVEYEEDIYGEDPSSTITVTGADGGTVEQSLRLNWSSEAVQRLDISDLESPLEFSAASRNVATEFEIRPLTGPVDSDEDGLPDVVEERRWTMPYGSYQNVTTDPYDPDTDGDSLEDGEEVRWRVLEAWDSTIYRVLPSANPARPDSDRDGLGDAEEAGEWVIQYTDSPGDTVAFLDSLRDADEDDGVPNLDQYLVNESVTSSIFLEDTDGDGLSDLQERRIGTHPNRIDTTRDGAIDSEARSHDQDPTLFDASGPEIMVHDADLYFEEFGFDRQYWIHYSLFDTAGVESAELLREGVVRASTEENGENAGGRLEFEPGYIEVGDDLVLGTEISLRATDEHGNTNREVGDTRNSVFAQASAALAGHGLGSVYIARNMGNAHGLAAGGAETVEMIRAFANDPRGYLEGIPEALSAISRIDEIIANLPQAVHRQQREANPHTRGSDEYIAYQEGWYRGYVGYMIIEMVVPGGQVSRVVRSSDRLTSTLNRLRNADRLAGLTRTLSRGSDIGRQAGRITHYQLTRGVRATASLPRAAAQRLVDQAPTAAMRYRVGRGFDRLPPRLREGLTPSEAGRLGRYLNRHPERGPTLLADGGVDVRNLIVRSEGLDEGTTQALLRAHARGDLDDDTLRRTARYVDDGRMDQADVRRMEEMLRERSTSPLIDETLDASDLLTISARNGDLENARMVVRDSSGRLRWLEEGDDNVGWHHILERHEDQFYTVGGVSSRRAIQEHVYRAIEGGVSRPDPSGGTGYVFETTSGQRITVITGDNGFIVTAHPGEPNWWS